MRSLFFYSQSLLPFLSFALGACGGTDGYPDDGELEGAAASALLNPNSLDPDALSAGALDPGALASNVLDQRSLAPSVRSAIQALGDDSELSRRLLRYIVACALDRTQTFRFSWTDAAGLVHDESYAGLLGLAPSWRRAPLSIDGQQWVSACVASRVNWYGVPVVISSRGPHPALSEPDELERREYPMQEGAFWGNLFADPLSLYACHHAPNDAGSRQHSRACAAGHPHPVSGIEECGPIHIVGVCDSMCDAPDPAGGYRSMCKDDAGGLSSNVITTFLPR
jgi:hypothetical protein